MSLGEKYWGNSLVTAAPLRLCLAHQLSRLGVALDAALNNLYWDQVGLILAIILQSS